MTYQTMCLIDFAQLVAVKSLNISVTSYASFSMAMMLDIQNNFHIIMLALEATTGMLLRMVTNVSSSGGGDTADDISIDGYASVSKERCEEAPEGQDDPDQPDQLLHHQGTALVLKKRKKSRNE